MTPASDSKAAVPLRPASVAAIIVGYNNLEQMKECLPTLVKTDYPNFRIVYVDNNSSDGSADFVAANYPNVEVVRFNANYGFVVYNRVISDVSDGYVVLLNADIIVEADWLSRLMECMQDDSVAAAVPKMLFSDNRRMINAAGGQIDIFGMSWNRGNGQLDNGQFGSIEEVFYGVGACLLIRRAIWGRIGGFDERYFMYEEDVDWCWRARVSGYKIIFTPKAAIYHHSLTPRNNPSFMIRYTHRNNLCSVLKNYQMRTLVFIVPALAGLRSLEALYFLLRLQGSVSLAILQGWYWNLSNLRATLRERRRIARLRLVPDSAIRNLMQKTSIELMLGLGLAKHPVTHALDKKP